MGQVNLWRTPITSDFSEYTLIIPSVSVGNVGQLACDLLISSMNMNKINSMAGPSVIPVVGYDAYKYGPGSLSGCCELYQCETKKILVLQLRAPLVCKYSQQFITEILDMFKARNIKDIIILGSSFAFEKRHIMTSQFRYAASELCPHISKIKSLEWVEHEPKEDSITLSGGGFASKLYQIATQKSVPCLLIYKFSSEGDNIPDAYEMVEYVNSIVPLFEGKDLYKQLIKPVSWSLLFGRPPPADIY